MHLVGATFTRIVVSLMTVGMFMAFLLPDIMCRVIIFVAIAHGLVMALELDPKSRISSAIIMAGFCSATSPGYGFLTGTEMSLIAMDQIKSIITIPTWGEYALANLPFIILYCCFSIFMCVKIIPGKEHIPHEDHLKEVVAERLRDMGPMTTQEWKLLILMICAITGLGIGLSALNGVALGVLVAIILLIFGTFMEGTAIAVLLVPVLWPIAESMGINVIHFGMILCISNVIGTMTPPVAVNIFSAVQVTRSVRELKIGEISKAEIPFFIGYVAVFFLCVFSETFCTFLIR